MSDAKTIRVEVVFALPERQVLRVLDVAPGTTMFDAVLLSRIADEFPGLIDPERIAMGVFSRIEPAPRQRVLREGDRVELYRPLLLDPNESRRERAQRARKKKRAGK